MATTALHHLVPTPLRSSDHEDKKDTSQDDNDDSNAHKHSHPSLHLHRHAPTSDELRYSQQQTADTTSQKQHHLMPWHHRSSDVEKDHEAEKRRVAHLAEDLTGKAPMEIEEILKDPNEKPVGHASQSLTVDDFELMKTLGTGESLIILGSRMHLGSYEGLRNQQ